MISAHAPILDVFRVFVLVVQVAFIAYLLYVRKINLFLLGAAFGILVVSCFLNGYTFIVCLKIRCNLLGEIAWKIPLFMYGAMLGLWWETYGFNSRSGKKRRMRHRKEDR